MDVIDSGLGRDSILAPFLKWAGGKRWLISSRPDLFPESYNCFFEPFLGSGAVYFHMRPAAAVLNDLNKDLIQTYCAVRDDWKAVYKFLSYCHRNHNKQFYYQMRDRNYRNPAKKAGRFIYLNRTCWNGLYRVNLNGKFNVPVGTKTNVVLDTDDFESTASVLGGANFLNSDFEYVIDSAEKNDFVFVDPPYTVKHNLNGFVKYNNKLFSWEDQIRLRDCVENAASRGVKVMLTNADHLSVRELYKDFDYMDSLNRLSVISGSSSFRGKYSELVVRTYK